jgi:hypothetical protein
MFSKDADGEEFFFYLVCEAVGTAATPGLLCQPRVIVKMIVEKQMECRLAGETVSEVVIGFSCLRCGWPWCRVDVVVMWIGMNMWSGGAIYIMSIYSVYCLWIFMTVLLTCQGARVSVLVKALRCKPEGRWFKS